MQTISRLRVPQLHSLYGVVTNTAFRFAFEGNPTAAKWVIHNSQVRINNNEELYFLGNNNWSPLRHGANAADHLLDRTYVFHEKRLSSQRRSSVYWRKKRRLSPLLIPPRKTEGRPSFLLFVIVRPSILALLLLFSPVTCTVTSLPTDSPIAPKEFSGPHLPTHPLIPHPSCLACPRAIKQQRWVEWEKGRKTF